MLLVCKRVVTAKAEWINQYALSRTAAASSPSAERSVRTSNRSGVFNRQTRSGPCFFYRVRCEHPRAHWQQTVLSRLLWT
jgi:hypothetical protein